MRRLEATVGHEHPDGLYGYITKGTLVDFEDFRVPGELASGRFKEVKDGGNSGKVGKGLPPKRERDELHERRDDDLGQSEVHDDGGER